MFPFARYVHLFPPSLQWVPWPLLAEPCGSPPSSVLWVRKTARPHPCPPLVSLGDRVTALVSGEMASSPGFLENPFESMPRARDSGDPGGASQYRSAKCSLPPCQQRRHRNHRVFGAEPSRPASLLCTLRTHQSPGEWQHSLPACSLAFAGRDLHPLDSIKWFHLLSFGSSSPKLSPAR